MYRYLAAAIVVFALGAWSSWTAQDWRYGAKEAERLQAAKEQVRKNEIQADKGAAGHEADRAQIRKQFITITREAQRVVESPLYRQNCFDEAGLELIRQAISGTGAATRISDSPSKAPDLSADQPVAAF